jgi:hypothetical protein
MSMVREFLSYTPLKHLPALLRSLLFPPGWSDGPLWGSQSEAYKHNHARGNVLIHARITQLQRTVRDQVQKTVVKKADLIE